MDPHVPLFPVGASTLAPRVDQLYLFLVSISVVMSGLIFLTIVVFAVRYRRRPGNMIASQTHGPVQLEIWWSVLPLLVFLGTFAWGASVYFERSRAPANAAVIYVVGKQWMWKLQHPEGPREINELHVPVGRAVRLVMTSEDVIHSFFIPAFRIKQDVIPGRYTEEWFEATQTGTYHIFCSEYCGTNHSRMRGSVHVMDADAYQRWLSGGSQGPSMEAAGERLFHTLGCATCHVRDAPPLQGLYGKRVTLANGSAVVADDAYLRESILEPAAKIVRGYPPNMPTYQGQVSEEGLMQLIAYIRSLAPMAPGTGDEKRSPE